MPRRRRTSKRRDELTLDRMVALTLGPAPGRCEPDEGLEDAYRLHRARVLAGYPPGRRPWGFWAFEPDVPAELRAGRPGLRPVGDDERQERRGLAADADLERRRRSWLDDNGPARASTAPGGAP